MFSRLFRPVARVNARMFSTSALAQIIRGDQIAAAVRAEVAAEVKALNLTPGLAVVLVGERKDSATYVRMKKKAAEECGFKSISKELSDDVSQEDLLAIVKDLNADSSVDGILVQLPLPAHIDQPTVLEAIDCDKDVDGFHPYNMGRLARSGEELRQRRQAWGEMGGGTMACTPLGCIELIKRSGYDLSGKHVVVLGRSNIVGLPAALMSLHCNATVTICHSRTQNLPDMCRQADVLIAAIGMAEFVQPDWVKPGACVIDVGVNFKEDSSKKSGQRMCGDVDFKGVREALGPEGAITPVPKGVGPMTIAMLMKNTLENAKLLRKN